MKPYYTVVSSTESIPVDHTGTPVESHPTIVQFNIAEYVGWCQRNGFEMKRGSTINILFIGYWYQSEEEEPCYEHPEREARRSHNALCA